MKFPGYPSNREADESAMETTAKAGRCASRMKPSRETCLHRDTIIPLGVGYAIGLTAFSLGYKKAAVCLVFLREGRFFVAKKPSRSFI